MTAILVFAINENELKINIEEVIITTDCVIPNLEQVYRAHRTKSLTALHV